MPSHNDIKVVNLFHPESAKGLNAVTYGVKEGDGHLKLLPPAILDIYTVFEHINMLSIGI